MSVWFSDDAGGSWAIADVNGTGSGVNQTSHSFVGVTESVLAPPKPATA